GRKAEWAAVLYGIGLALTFDEFGMWLHLGGGYWQRASFDAVTVVVGLLMLLAFGPSLKKFHGRHAITVLILLLLGAGFFFMLIQTVNKYGQKAQPRLEKLGQGAPYQSQRDAASGTAERSARLIAPRAQAFRQMPQP
ncbi:MAG: hypothetical protein NT147_00775, partial [Candidatus Aminicenantes bacterium]|nr:hypothetical protein [Candidatus Aminicenantes bacterium]